MHHKSTAKLLSLLLLSSLILTQVIPMQALQAASARLPQASVQSNALAVRPNQDLATACNTSDPTTKLAVCFTDGTSGSAGIQVFHIGNPVPDTEPSNDSGGLQASVGDTVRIPFALANTNSSGQPCPTIVVDPLTLKLRLNPSLGAAQRDITPTVVTYPAGAPNTVTFADNVVGPFTTASVDTAYGYFEFVVIATDAVPSTGNKSYINFQINVRGLCGGVGGTLIIAQNNIEGSPLVPDLQVARRVEVVGALFTAANANAPDHVSEGNTLVLPFTISNSGGKANFTLAATALPPLGAPPIISVSYNGAQPTSGPGQLDSGQIAIGTVTIGPFNSAYGNSVAVALAVTGTLVTGGAPAHQILNWTIPVRHPRVSITKKADRNPALYKPGDVITYTITVTNSGDLPLTNFNVLDSLTGVVTAPNTPLPPGQKFDLNVTYTVKTTDPNPLPNTATVNAQWTPTAPDTGVVVQVFDSTTYQVQVESANLDVRFGTGPTPPYAQPGKAVSGTITVSNTGTQVINNVTANVQFVDPADLTVSYASALISIPASIPPDGTNPPLVANYSIALPLSLPQGVDSVVLLITVNGVSTRGVTINRQLKQQLDVVLSKLRVSVTNDAPSGIVARGQIVTYTVFVQNVDTVASVDNIVIFSDSLNALPGVPINVGTLAPGASSPSISYTFKVLANSANPLIEAVTANFTGGTATGRSVLDISDIQLFVSKTAECVVLLIGDTCQSTGAQPIIGNAISIPGTAPVIVRYAVLVQNVGQTTVTGVSACEGNAFCPSTDPAFIGLDFGNSPSGTLYSFGIAKAEVNISIPATTPSPYINVITVTALDQQRQQVTFRGTSTLQIISPNKYWTVTKTANVASAFVGDTITYNVSACYDGTDVNNPPVLTGVKATDPFIPGNGLVTLTVTPGGASGTTVDLPKGSCAAGTYTYIANNQLLGDVPGPVDLVNIVTFTADVGQTATVTRSVTIKLFNPLKVIKTVSPVGPVFAGEALSYSYTFLNLGTHDITNLTASDDKFQTAPFPAPAFPATLAAGATLTINYPVAAIAIDGPLDKVVGNMVTANGTITNGATAVAVAATASAKITVRSPLLVTKTPSNFGPFVYDPPITYTISIQNISPTNVTLTDASDSLGSIIMPTVDASISIIINGGAPRALAGAVLAPNDTATLSYKLLPIDAPRNNGGFGTDNTFTVKAFVGPDTPKSHFTTFAKATIIIYQPLIVWNACPQYPYYGWKETAHWTFQIANGSDVAPNAVSMTNIKVTTNLLPNGQLLPLKDAIGTTTDFLPPPTQPFPTRERLTGNVDFAIPWRYANLNFDDIYFKVEYDIPEKGIHEFWTETPADAGCAGVQIGPPLKVTKVPSVANTTVGTPVTYTVTVANPMFDPADIVTNINALDVTFSNTLLTLKDASNQTVIQLNPGTYDPVSGVSTPGGSGTASITRAILASDPPTLVNTVSVTGKLGGVSFPDPITAKATVSLPSPLIKLKLTPDKTDANPGDVITYSLDIDNSSANNIHLDDATTDKTAEPGQDASANLQAWITANGGTGIVAAGVKVTIPNIVQVRVPNTSITGPFAVKLTLKYTPVTTPATPQATAEATATVNILNPNLRVLLTTQPAIVVAYGQTVVYTETIKNPETATADITNLIFSDTSVAGIDIPTDWFDGQTDVGPNPPTTLAPGKSVTRRVTHNVTTADQSPLVFTATAQAQYTPDQGVTQIPVQDTKVSSITISSAQLLLFPTPDKPQVRAGDQENISITITNIGAIAVKQLTLKAQITNLVGSTPQPIALLPQIPGSDPNNPNLLQPFSATTGTYTFSIPNPLPAGYPNPLIVTFTADGITNDDLPFNSVTATITIKVLQPNLFISETPDVSAATVGSTVTYSVIVNNPGPDPINITGVVDNNTNQPVLLTFPGAASPTATGTLQRNENAIGRTTAPITALQPNPFLHTTTATGTTVPTPPATAITVSDTSVSQVNVLGSYLSAVLTANPTQANVGSPVTFTVRITNTGTGSITTLTAKAVDQGNLVIPLKDTNGVPLVLPLPPGGVAVGTYTFTPTVTGPYTSHVQVDAVNDSGQPLSLLPAATINVTGISLIFSQAVALDKTSAKAGDVVTATFKLKNPSTDPANDLVNVTAICVNGNCSAVTPPLTTLDHGQETPVESLAYTVQPTDTGTVTLTIKATAAQKGNPAITTTVSQSATFTVSVGGLVLTKTADKTTARVGDTITYTVNLQNTNATPITVTQFTDSLLGNILNKLANPVIAAGATATATYTYVVPAGAAGTLTNTVAATFTLNGTTQTAQASANVAIIATGSTLSVTVVPSRTTAAPGSTITYTINVTNGGTTPITGLGATSSLFGLVTNVTGVVAPGATVTFVTSSYIVPVGATGTLTNTITVTGQDANNANVSAVGTANVTLIGAGGLTVSKSANVSTARPGDNVIYTINVSNNGTAPINITAISDTLIALPAITLPVNLAPGASLPPINITRTVLATDPATLRNTVNVAATDSNGSTFNGTAFADVLIIQPGNTGLLISAVPSTSVIAPNGTIIYNVTIRNVGTVRITGLTATYTAPGGTAVSISGLSLTALDPGQQATGSFQYSVGTTPPNPVVLQLKAQGTAGTNPVSATGQTPPVAVVTGSLTALLVADQTTAPAVGGKINYTLTIINTSSPAITLGGLNLSIDTPPSNIAPTLPTVQPNLAAGSSIAVPFSYTVQAGDAGKATLDLEIKVASTSPQAQTIVRSSIRQAMAGFAISVAPCSPTPCIVRPGGTIPITFTVTNTGDKDLQNLKVVFAGNPPSAPIPLPKTTLKVGESLTPVTFNYNVPPTATGTSIIVTVAGVADTGPASQPVQAFGASSPYTLVNPKVAITAVTINPTPPVPDGSQVTISATIANQSTPAGTSLYLSGATPVMISINGASPVNVPVPVNTTLAPAGQSGSTLTVTYQYTIKSTDPNPVPYTISVSACPLAVQLCTPSEAVTAASSGLISIVRANLNVTTSITPNPAAVGQPVTVTLSLKNTGTVDLVNLNGSVVITTSGVAPTDTLQLPSTRILLANSASTLIVTFTHTVTATDPNPLQYTFTFTGNSGSVAGPAVTQSIPVSIPVTGLTGTNTPPTNITVTKTADVTNVQKGSAVVFTIVVTNTTTAALSGVTLTDALPSTLTAGTATSDVGTATASGSSVTVPIGTLNANQSATIKINATVGDVTAPATIVNQACAAVTGNTTPACGSVTLTVASGASTLPTTGIGPVSGDNSSLFLLFALGSIFILALALGRNPNNRRILIVVGIVVGMIVTAEALSIGVSLINRARSAPTGTAVAAQSTAIVVGKTPVKPPTLTTGTPLPPGSTPPTLPPDATATIPVGKPTGTPVPPLFAPVGDKSIFIPKLKLSSAVPIVELPLKNKTWDVQTLGHNVGHLEKTSWLGTNGNTVLVAHIQLTFQDMGPFQNLNQLVKGDKVLVADQGKFYTYEVSEVKTVDPTAVEVTYPTVDPIVTLITCTLWDAHRGAFAKRLVVTAKLLVAPQNT